MKNEQWVSIWRLRASLQLGLQMNEEWESYQSRMPDALFGLWAEVESCLGYATAERLLNPLAGGGVTGKMMFSNPKTIAFGLQNKAHT
jgi:hypothetical protein